MQQGTFDIELEERSFTIPPDIWQVQDDVLEELWLVTRSRRSEKVEDEELINQSRPPPDKKTMTARLLSKFLSILKTYSQNPLPGSRQYPNFWERIPTIQKSHLSHIVMDTSHLDCSELL